MDYESSVTILNQPKDQQLTNGDAKGIKIPNGLKVPNRLSYSKTLNKLMGFDNNSTVLKRINSKDVKDSKNKLKLLTQLLELINIRLEDLNGLNVIHVAGTKGKGSTCAYVERILRERGYKTGLYTSPHLVSVRDRIRISGQPLSKDSFVDYFWAVQNKISQHHEKPGFFMFLTLLSFHIFLEEKVDVVILETGIGGEFDCTNIVPAPVVTGIASLGIDHTTVLGDTLESIAWHKAGILKPGVPCYTSPQMESALNVIFGRSREKDCPVFVCPPMDSYKSLTKITLGIDGQVQKVNASLALQLSRYWHIKHSTKLTSTNDIHSVQVNSANSFTLDDAEIRGLENTKWQGRCHLITRGRVNYFLDGAHTVESLDNCLEWYNQKSREMSSNGSVFRVLCFFSAGLRQYEPLIRRVASESFDLALFPTNYVDNYEKYPELIMDSRYDVDGIIDRITKTRQLWQSVQRDNQRNSENYQQAMSLSQTLNYLESTELIDSIGDNVTLHALVTGSLIFVGNVLTIIDSNQ